MTAVNIDSNWEGLCRIRLVHPHVDRPARICHAFHDRSASSCSAISSVVNDRVLRSARKARALEGSNGSKT